MAPKTMAAMPRNSPTTAICRMNKVRGRHMSKRVGVYPGTFDPITNGHYDIIRRALHVVDHLVIGVARNDAKGPLFSTDERVEIVRDEMRHLENGAADRVEVR